jgi:hypothetical protein
MIRNQRWARGVGIRELRGAFVKEKEESFRLLLLLLFEKSEGGQVDEEWVMKRDDEGWRKGKTNEGSEERDVVILLLHAVTLQKI